LHMVMLWVAKLHAYERESSLHVTCMGLCLQTVFIGKQSAWSAAYERNPMPHFIAGER
jgi:hypothetical protein